MWGLETNRTRLLGPNAPSRNHRDRSLKRRALRRTYPPSVRRVAALWVSGSLAILVASCGQSETVDGWPLGREIPCEFRTRTPDADPVVATGLRAVVGDAVVIDHRCFYPGPYSVDGHPIAWESAPGGVEIHVFTLSDGSRHAVTIGCPGLATLRPGQPRGSGPDCIVMPLP